MVRSLIILTAAMFVAGLVAVLVDYPGQITVDWMGYRLETAMSLMAVLLVAAFAIFLAVLRLFSWIIGGPAKWRRFFGRQKARKGMGALTQGLAAAAAGDASQARRHAVTAERLAKEGPLARVLALEAAELEGRSSDVVSLARGLLDHPGTQLLGRRALFDQARAAGNQASAMDEAEAAFENHPAAGWAAEALLADAVLVGEWTRAKSIYARAERHDAFTNGRSSRIKAALMQAEALDLAAGHGDGKALGLAKKAHDADASFAPAPILMAEIFGRQGKIKRLQKLIEDTWEALPHPDLGRIYAEMIPGERQIETLERLRGLTNHNAGHVESRLLFAAYAIAARNFAAGRDALKGLLLAGASSRAFAAMAALDRAEQGTAAAAEDWIAKAIAAPRDAVWVCGGCGHQHQAWHAVCNRCTALGTLEWATHLKAPAAKDTAPVAVEAAVEIEAEPVPALGALTEAGPVAEIETAPDEGPDTALAVEVETPLAPEASPPSPIDEGLRQPDDPGTDKDRARSGETTW